MQFSRYLRQMGQLYFEGAISGFHPNLLRRFGGSLAMVIGQMAGAHADARQQLHETRQSARSAR